MLANSTLPASSDQVVALATACLSVLLPHSTTVARRRLAAVIIQITTNDWSDATISALARRHTDWLALANQFGKPISDLHQMTETGLLTLLVSNEVTTQTAESPKLARPPPGREPGESRRRANKNNQTIFSILSFTLTKT